MGAKGGYVVCVLLQFRKKEGGVKARSIVSVHICMDLEREAEIPEALAAIPFEVELPQ